MKIEDEVHCHELRRYGPKSGKTIQIATAALEMGPRYRRCAGWFNRNLGRRVGFYISWNSSKGRPAFYLRHWHKFFG